MLQADAGSGKRLVKSLLVGTGTGLVPAQRAVMNGKQVWPSQFTVTAVPSATLNLIVDVTVDGGDQPVFWPVTFDFGDGRTGEVSQELYEQYGLPVMYSAPGTYTITATDRYGQVSSTEVVVEQIALWATMTLKDGCKNTWVLETNAVGSSSVVWGDGQTTTWGGQPGEHVYPRAGTYQVTVSDPTLADDPARVGRVATAIVDQPDVFEVLVSVDGPTQVATFTITNGEAGVFPLEVDFGDNSVPEEFTAGPVTHRYAEYKTYSATVSSAGVVEAVQVSVPVPFRVEWSDEYAASAMPRKVRVHLYNGFEAVPYPITFDWGDGTSSSIPNVGSVPFAHTYTATGRYTTVATGADGKRVVTEMTATGPAVLSISARQTAPLTATLTAVDATWPLDVAWGDNSLPETYPQTTPMVYKYSAAGTYTVQAWTPDGKTATCQATVAAWALNWTDQSATTARKVLFDLVSESGAIWPVDIAYGDGTTVRRNLAGTFGHTYPAAGDYTVVGTGADGSRLEFVVTAIEPIA